MTKTAAWVRIRRACALPFLLLTLSLSASAQVRVVAVGDVHGAYPEFSGILLRVGLIDTDRQWIGGSSVFVQTGDVLDRGTQSRACLDLLMALEAQAEKHNGRVIPLLGNHEVMVLIHDLRYVLAEDYRAFASDQSEKVRERAYREYREFLEVHSSHRHPAVPDDEPTRQKWMGEHPLGFFEYCDAFGPQGLYGRWLRAHRAVAQVGDAIFVHGGLNPKLHFRNIEELNDRVHSELTEFDSLWRSLCDKKIIWRYMKLDDAIRQVQEEWRWIQARGQVEDPVAAEKMQTLLDVPRWLILSPDGPAWYRGLALQPEELLKSDLEAMLARLKVRYLVAGHTVRPKAIIASRFDNHVFLIDTGMLKAEYNGQASALEIQGGTFTAYYLDGGKQVLLTPEGGASSPALGPGEGKPKWEP